MKQNPAMIESSDSEFEDDIAQVTGKQMHKKKKSETLESDENSDQSLGEEEEDDEELDNLEDEEASDVEDDEDLEDEMGSMEEDFSEDEELEVPKSKSSLNKKRVQFQDEVESEQSNSIKKRKVDTVDESAEDVDDEDDDSLGGGENAEDLVGDDEKEVAKERELWEDIYGRTRDKKGNVVEVNLLIYCS
jgi:hypothetical protein